jgi:curved DNA-binding protein CbpA
MAGRYRQVIAAAVTLEIEPNASENEIRKAFRKLSLAWHPDRNPERREEAEKRFKMISRAREILTDRAARSQEELREREAYERDGPSERRGSAGEMAPPVDGCSKGWGPCPSCGGLKRHVGGRACPTFGKWFEEEKRLDNYHLRRKPHHLQAKDENDSAIKTAGASYPSGPSPGACGAAYADAHSSEPRSSGVRVRGAHEVRAPPLLASFRWRRLPTTPATLSSLTPTSGRSPTTCITLCYNVSLFNFCFGPRKALDGAK